MIENTGRSLRDRPVFSLTSLLFTLFPIHITATLYLMSKRITFSLAWYVLAIWMIVIIFILASMSFISYKLYQKVITTEKIQKEILDKQNSDRLIQEQKIIEQEQKSKVLIDLQQKALDDAKLELTKTKTEAEITNAKIKSLSQVVEDQSLLPKEIVISSKDLSPYTTGIVQVICSKADGVSSGSGTLWTFKEKPYSVITNYHVVKESNKCVISLTNSANETIGMFNMDDSVYTFNKNTDEAILSIGESISSSSVPVANYNYSLSNVRKCPNEMPVGSPVVIIGYPAYAKRSTTLDISTIGKVNSIYRTVTNGIISGYDSSQGGNANYFVSAKIDNGNSGGMALGKDGKGICILGLPTWLTVGNYETQGLVQNITNVLPGN